MIKEFTGRGVARSRRERYQRTRWTEDIQVTFLECDDAEEADKPDREADRTGSDVKVEVPPPASSKSLFLQAARLRNKDSQQFGGVGKTSRVTLPARPASPAIGAKWAEVLDQVRALLQTDELNLDEAQTLLEALKRHVPPARPKVETVLETFDGVLNCIDGDTARLTLTSTANGAVYYAQYPAAEFEAKGIEEDDRFICKTVESEGGTRIEIEAVPDVELTEEHIRAIREKIQRVLPRNDPGVRY